MGIGGQIPPLLALEVLQTLALGFTLPLSGAEAW
jgi:hypothetical protein